MDDLILQEVHNEWKQKGFPYYPKDRKWRDNIFNQLVNFKRIVFAHSGIKLTEKFKEAQLAHDVHYR